MFDSTVDGECRAVQFEAAAFRATTQLLLSLLCRLLPVLKGVSSFWVYLYEIILEACKEQVKKQIQNSIAVADGGIAYCTHTRLL